MAIYQDSILIIIDRIITAPLPPVKGYSTTIPQTGDIVSRSGLADDMSYRRKHSTTGFVEDDYFTIEIELNYTMMDLLSYPSKSRYKHYASK